MLMVPVEASSMMSAEQKRCEPLTIGCLRHIPGLFREALLPAQALL